MFVDQATYLQLVRVIRAQPVQRRPNFLDASQKVGVDRRTIATGWERGWPATKDPRRPASLPPLREVCTPGAEPPPGLYPIASTSPVAGAGPMADVSRIAAAVAASPVATPGGAQAVSAGPGSGPSAPAPGVEPGHEASAPAPPSAPAPASTPPAPAPAATPAHDPVAEIAARQSALEVQEGKNLVGALSVATNIVATGNGVLKQLFDGVSTPEAQARLRSFITEKPERFMSLLAELAKAVESSTKASERIFSMTRLAAGQATSIQEHRGDSRPPVESPSQTAARVRAVFAELAAVGAVLGEKGRSPTPIDVTPVEEGA
jgi:hypothetical protein